MTTRILLIEDNPRDQRLVQIGLAEALDFEQEMFSCPDFASGLTHLAQGTTDVVLLDLNLPDMTGVEGVKGLRDAHPEVPVIVLTGLEDQALGDEAIRAGAQDFLVKGKMFGELLWRSIRYARERHRILLELQACQG